MFKQLRSLLRELVFQKELRAVWWLLQFFKFICLFNRIPKALTTLTEKDLKIIVGVEGECVGESG